jgi:HAD superfamily hydrolase (TIGR01549 family)
MYEAILFDLDDTLLDFCTCEKKALRKAFTLAEIEVADGIWSAIWNTYKSVSDRYWQQRSSGLSRQQIIEASLKDTFIALEDNSSDSSELARIYWNTFCQTAYLNPDVKETIELLSDDYKLGIMTNGYTDSQESRLQASGLANYFQSVVISESVGYRKPAPEIFNIALNDLQVKPGVTLFVGDSVTHDRQGAINAGLDFCYYDRRSIQTNCKYKITHISQLIQIVREN